MILRIHLKITFPLFLIHKNRVSILEVIRKIKSIQGGYLAAYRQCSQNTKNNNLKLRIHGFSTLVNVFLNMELEERNINSIFLTIDKDKNGYIDEDEFVKTVELIKDK